MKKYILYDLSTPQPPSLHRTGTAAAPPSHRFPSFSRQVSHLPRTTHFNTVLARPRTANAPQKTGGGGFRGRRFRKWKFWRSRSSLFWYL